MTDFTIKVCPDHNNVGTNVIDVFIKEGSEKSSVEVETEYELYVDEYQDEGFDISKVALYYAVERIAQLEAKLEEERAKKSNLTLQVVQDKWRSTRVEAVKLRFNYAGVISLLANLSGRVEDEDTLDIIERAVSDWCELSGWTYRIKFGSLELVPPEEADDDQN